MSLDVPGLFVTGTDTGVGKTFVTAMIAGQLRGDGLTVGAYKPACSGSVETPAGSVWDDVEILHRATGGRCDRDRICPQRFHAPLAPPVAAKQEGRSVDRDRLREGATWWVDRCDLLLVEGVGGFLCPLTETTTVADLAVELRFPLIVVARATLGTINHTLLTIEAARSRALTVAGVLLNTVVDVGDDASIATNAEEIARRTGVAVLGILPHGPPARLLTPPPQRRIEWAALARR
ncbi:MAG: dethiobiotin synthase [Planctomycetaceae bacterium]